MGHPHDQIGHSPLYSEFAMSKGVARGADGNRVGVYGFSETSTGVYGQSAQDVGVYGRGGILAGQFDGNVAITGGTLQINGQDVAQQIAALQAQVAILLDRLKWQWPAVAVPGPTLRLEPIPDADQPANQRIVRISGEGFTPQHELTLRVVDGGTWWYETTLPKETVDAEGRIIPETHVQVAIPTTSAPLYASATDGRANVHDLTGLLWSNQVVLGG